MTIALACSCSSMLLSNKYSGESSLLKRVYSKYSFIVTFSFLPESLSPTLKSESPNLSESLYAQKRKRICCWLVMCLPTYLELPFLHATPVVWNTCDNAWTAPFLVSFDEFFDSKVIDVDPLNSVCKCVRVVYFKEFVLSTPIAILAPLAQKKTASML